VACTAPLGHSTRRAYRLVEQSATCGSCPTATNVATLFSLPCVKGGGTACRDGGIVLLCFATSTIPQSASLTAPLTQGSLPLRRKLGKAKAFWNHQHCWWFSLYKKTRCLTCEIIRVFLYIKVFVTIWSIHFPPLQKKVCDHCLRGLRKPHSSRKPEPPRRVISRFHPERRNRTKPCCPHRTL